jgi:hypothetical protein
MTRKFMSPSNSKLTIEILSLGLRPLEVFCDRKRRQAGSAAHHVAKIEKSQSWILDSIESPRSIIPSKPSDGYV